MPRIIDILEQHHEEEQKRKRNHGITDLSEILILYGTQTHYGRFECESIQRYGQAYHFYGVELPSGRCRYPLILDPAGPSHMTGAAHIAVHRSAQTRDVKKMLPLQLYYLILAATYHRKDTEPFFISKLRATLQQNLESRQFYPVDILRVSDITIFKDGSDCAIGHPLRRIEILPPHSTGTNRLISGYKVHEELIKTLFGEHDIGRFTTILRWAAGLPPGEAKISMPIPSPQQHHHISMHKNGSDLVIDCKEAHVGSGIARTYRWKI